MSPAELKCLSLAAEVGMGCVESQVQMANTGKDLSTSMVSVGQTRSCARDAPHLPQIVLRTDTIEMVLQIWP